jgi:polyisoprenoid-binding protein YceI
MESEKFKTATFKGQINEKINWKKEGSYIVTVTGILNVHGVEKSRTIKGKLMVKERRIRVQTKFELKLVDHDIEIPTVVFQKIAEVIDVTVDLQFSPKK